ncbi:MAG: F0F1 ATP synthase subunit alpha [Candidatus Omnitrophica bacterium]|nr:F0F1 ATP synthase subunit alpha [Candidatus Omnitrophota bacterium]
MDFRIPTLDIKEVGLVKEVKQGIVKIDGLPSCAYGELLQFPNRVKGIVIGFNQREVNAIVLGKTNTISVGDEVSSLSELVNVPVGEGFLGRVVNSMAEPIDGKGPIPSATFAPAFREAPGIMDRNPIDKSLLTGIKIIDLMIPIGKGQRELIIGDRQSGKSVLCLDAIINQKDKDVVCIYCWIGGPSSDLKKHVHVLRKNQALPYTIVVSAGADASVAEQYLAPYTAAALGEHLMGQGKDVLVVFDDLTKHAWIYREMSLLLERSPGREAYPGDIFYLHSQLMERAGYMSGAKGGGSMTFLPIAETLQGDITGYIQTNLISMTDGQIYISTNLFKEGFKPAIDLGLSVSRIGSKVQCPAIREVSMGLRLEYAQYREMLRFTKLRTRLAPETLEQMRRGETLQALMMQANNTPVPLSKEILLFYAFQRKILEVIPREMLQKFMDEFYPYLRQNFPEVVQHLEDKKELTPEIKKEVGGTFVSFFREYEAREEASRLPRERR